MRGEGRQPHCNSPPYGADLEKIIVEGVAHRKALAEAEKIVVED